MPGRSGAGSLSSGRSSNCSRAPRALPAPRPRNARGGNDSRRDASPVRALPIRAQPLPLPLPPLSLPWLDLPWPDLPWRLAMPLPGPLALPAPWSDLALPPPWSDFALPPPWSTWASRLDLAATGDLAGLALAAIGERTMQVVVKGDRARPAVVGRHEALLEAMELGRTGLDAQALGHHTPALAVIALPFVDHVAAGRPMIEAIEHA